MCSSDLSGLPGSPRCPATSFTLRHDRILALRIYQTAKIYQIVETAPRFCQLSRRVLRTIFAVTGRIWMLMFAHAAFDLTPLAIIYWNLKSAVAH